MEYQNACGTVLPQHRNLSSFDHLLLWLRTDEAEALSSCLLRVLLHIESRLFKHGRERLGCQRLIDSQQVMRRTISITHLPLAVEKYDPVRQTLDGGSH